MTLDEAVVGYATRCEALELNVVEQTGFVKSAAG